VCEKKKKRVSVGSTRENGVESREIPAHQTPTKVDKKTKKKKRELNYVRFSLPLQPHRRNVSINCSLNKRKEVSNVVTTAFDRRIFTFLTNCRTRS
jgi:GTP-binding protein EngB required for normal cell division